MDMFKSTLLMLLVYFSNHSALAADVETVYLPARFADGGDSFLGQLNFETEDPNFSATAFCDVKANVKGRIKNPLCMITDWDHMVYKKHIEKKLSNYEILPATIDGKAVEVKVKLTISYFCESAKCRGMISLNDGQLKNQYGLNYVAPQLIINQANAVLFQGAKHYEPGLKYSIEVSIDQQGNPGDINVLQVNPDYKKWVRKIKRNIPREQYIPGIYNAEYTAMPYYYVFWVDKSFKFNALPRAT